MPVVVEGNRLIFEGEINSGTVAELMDETLAHVREGIESIDFGGVSDVDSAAVALALACAREAKALDRTLAFTNLPPKFISLARLYNISDLFTDASPV